MAHLVRLPCNYSAVCGERLDPRKTFGGMSKKNNIGQVDEPRSPQHY
jgi:hypothetical protein